jgi:hypothetical protein
MRSRGHDDFSVSERGMQLLEMVDGQISALSGLLSSRGEAALSLACPGREKLGDGTVAACALHTADSYDRIAAFVNGGVLGGPGSNYGADHVELQDLLDQLSVARGALSVLADLTDEQIDRVPPASGMKFCDGQRSLEQVVTSLLKHQSHSLDALKAALS